jgi:exonuclease III
VSLSFVIIKEEFRQHRLARNEDYQMKIMTWNIRHGGTSKTYAGIISTIFNHNPDIIILTEYRKESGDVIEPELHSKGWRYNASTPTTAKKNGILVSSRFSFERIIPDFELTGDHRYRWLEIMLKESDLHILAVHIPDHRKNDTTGKKAFWNRVNEYALKNMAKRGIIIGDFNTGLKIDAQGTPFTFSECMKTLNQSGWLDSWRCLNPDKREFTWYSSRKGADLNGFRLDYAYLSPVMKDSLIQVYHSHKEGADRISDHSSLMIEIECDSNIYATTLVHPCT